MTQSEQHESAVRSYCRSFPVVFQRAKGSFMYTENGEKYLDFFNGAGALNYGHNNDFLKEKILAYLNSDGIIHALDLYTDAKEEFLKAFHTHVLSKLGADYKVQFCGPTGTNANEAALKLARKCKQRNNVLAFTGSFHGMTLGSLSVTSGTDIRRGAGVPLSNVTFMPFPSGFNKSFDTIAYMENVLTDDHSGVEKPAAVIFETVQAEGGVNVAQIEWLQRLEKLCRAHDILTVCDEIQVGCGRTGTFFSFQRAGILPDMISVSKSVSGYGFPMSLLLVKEQYDIWKPGEHNGTFRGNQLAFVAAKAALEYREQNHLEQQVARSEQFIRAYLEEQILPLHPLLQARGIGMIWGIDFAGIDSSGSLTKRVANACFARRLVIERAGRKDTVLKLMPALTTTREELQQGLDIIRDAVRDVLCDADRAQ